MQHGEAGGEDRAGAEEHHDGQPARLVPHRLGEPPRRRRWRRRRGTAGRPGWRRRGRGRPRTTGRPGGARRRAPAATGRPGRRRRRCPARRAGAPRRRRGPRPCRAARTSPPTRNASQIRVTATKRATGESWSRLAATSQIRPMPTNPPPRYSSTRPMLTRAWSAVGRYRMAMRSAWSSLMRPSEAQSASSVRSQASWRGGTERGMTAGASMRPAWLGARAAVVSTSTQLWGAVGPAARTRLRAAFRLAWFKGGVSSNHLTRTGVALAVLGGLAGGTAYGARELLHRQAAQARRAIGKPLGEQAPVGGPALQEEARPSPSTCSCSVTPSPPGSARSGPSTPWAAGWPGGSPSTRVARCGCGPLRWWARRAACSPRSSTRCRRRTDRTWRSWSSAATT